MPKQNFKRVYVFLDTDKHASPFDILKTIDTLPEVAVLKYENVTVEDAERIVYDIMFPRGPEGAKHTKIFINGRDFDLANKMLEKIKACMFPPFELSILIDPRGAYTTASAAVAKTLELSRLKNLRDLAGKTVVILAGTGPVGQTAARLYVAEKAKVIITSRGLQRASSVASAIAEESGSGVVLGLQAQDAEEVGRAIERADIILSAGAARVQLLPLSILQKYGKNCKIVADINAIPPFGIEGLKSEADGEEFLPKVFGIGALAIGKLKETVEAELIRKAAEEPKGIFDYRTAYEIAKKRALEKRAIKEETVRDSSKYWLP